MSDKKKILVAEDSSVIINLTKSILQFENFDIIPVRNGNDVLKTLEKNEVVLVLMDINLPGMDGMECSKLIRANSNATISKLPIIAITGNYKNYTLDEFHKAGINEYLQKPLDYDLLVTTIKKYV